MGAKRTGDDRTLTPTGNAPPVNGNPRFPSGASLVPLTTPLRYPVRYPFRSPIGVPIEFPIRSPFRSPLPFSVRFPIGLPIGIPTRSPLPFPTFDSLIRSSFRSRRLFARRFSMYMVISLRRGLGKRTKNGRRASSRTCFEQNKQTKTKTMKRGIYFMKKNEENIRDNMKREHKKLLGVGKATQESERRLLEDLFRTEQRKT